MADHSGLKDQSFTHETKSRYQFFYFGNITYRITFNRKFFITALKLTIRATTGNGCFYDTIDLYSGKSRNLFALSVCRTCGISAEKVAEQLIRILEFLEKKRDETLHALHNPTVSAVPEEHKSQALKQLQASDLFDRIADDMQKLGCTARKSVKQFAYVCAASRKLDNPLSAVFVSETSIANHTLIQTVTEMLPAEEVIYLNGITESVFNRIGSLNHAVIILTDIPRQKSVMRIVRHIILEKKITQFVSKKNEYTGKMEKMPVVSPALAAVIMSDTAMPDRKPDDEYYFIIATADTSGISADKPYLHRLKYSLEEHRRQKERTQIMQLHRTMQHLLIKRNIVNDFAQISLPDEYSFGSDYEYIRFMDLMAAVCFLRQYQKQEQKHAGCAFISCDMEDYRISYEMIRDVCPQNAKQRLTAGEQALYNSLQVYAKREAKKHCLSEYEIPITQRRVRETFDYTQTWVKIHMRKLLEQGYVNLVKGGTERSKAIYHLSEEAGKKQTAAVNLPPPDVMTVIRQKEIDLDILKK